MTGRLMTFPCEHSANIHSHVRYMTLQAIAPLRGELIITPPHAAAWRSRREGDRQILSRLNRVSGINRITSMMTRQTGRT